MIEGLPQYRCHKVVGAVKIGVIYVRKDEGFARFHCVDNHVIDVPYERYFAHKPEEGWYLVQYEDGYLSFSPPFAFEAGYTRIEEPAVVPATPCQSRSAQTGERCVLVPEHKGHHLGRNTVWTDGEAKYA